MSKEFQDLVKPGNLIYDVRHNNLGIVIDITQRWSLYYNKDCFSVGISLINSQLGYNLTIPCDEIPTNLSSYIRKPTDMELLLYV